MVCLAPVQGRLSREDALQLWDMNRGQHLDVQCRAGRSTSSVAVTDLGSLLYGYRTLVTSANSNRENCIAYRGGMDSGATAM